jgi:hypothetical protein
MASMWLTHSEKRADLGGVPPLAKLLGDGDPVISRWPKGSDYYQSLR